ncbi:hypothetical protein CXQ80_02575 [Pseudomonas sp. 02C 26]|nr:hypothetical protein CXQ80_02575 [Pseudomonas sp. 02C 26]RZI82449.1 MAG: hypothetical protein EOP15_19970 [Pseudomonas sp.]
MVMELTAARDLSRFIEKFSRWGRRTLLKPPRCAILPRLRRGAKIPEFTGRGAERNISLSRTHHSAEPCRWP